MASAESGIHRLAIELIERILAQLDIRWLVRASHVCQSWRLIACDDPLYWRRIVIRDISPQTLDFAEHRLTCGRGRLQIYFELGYKLQDPVVERRLLPMLASALSRARVLIVVVESLYRMQVEELLSSPADHLEILHLMYTSYPQPDLFLTLPLSSNLFDGTPGKLKQVRLRNVILGQKPIAAFLDVEEAWWMHDPTSYQAEFPCYLFDFFPKVKRLRLCGGQIWFRNAPLPTPILNTFAQLTWVDIEFQEAFQSAFFRHLPMDVLPELVIAGAEFDAVYTALEPLRSYFDLALTNTYPNEFYITIKGQSPLLRHFSEAYKYYRPYQYGSELANCLFSDEAFFAQLGSMQIQTSLWSLLHPWLPALTHLPKLIVEIDDDRPVAATLPSETLSCPQLITLVIQAKHDFARVEVADLLDFADRITANHVTLELRRVLVNGQRERLNARFESVDYSLKRYLITPVP